MYSVSVKSEISIAAENLPLPRRDSYKKKGEPRRCRDNYFENLWIFKSVTDLN
jgi:hypothetical protein